MLVKFHNRNLAFRNSKPKYKPPLTLRFIYYDQITELSIPIFKI